MTSPPRIDANYTYKEALGRIRDQLQQSEEDQNKLDGGASRYQFKLEDAEEYLKDTEGDGKAVKEQKDIASFFRNPEG